MKIYKSTSIKSCSSLIIILLLSGVGLINAETAQLSDLPASLQYTASEAIGHNQSAYHAEAEADGFRAATLAQNYTTHFDAQGITLTTGQSHLTLRLTGVGYGERLTAVKPTLPIGHDNRIEYRRGVVTEWYVNGPLGLQQGFTLAERPEPGFHLSAGSADEPLTLALTLSAGWQTIVSADGRSLSLTSDGISLRYGDLVVADAGGVEQSARFSRDPISNTVHILIDDHTAVYPLTVDPFIQQAYLKASNAEAGDCFGNSVAISGDYAVVGAWFERGNGSSPGDNSAPRAGAAYVFVRSGAVWSQQAYLKADNAEYGDEFGYSVAISGDYVVVGADLEDSNPEDWAGAAYVFKRSGTIWSQQAYLKASNADGSDYFGFSVAISGDYVVVGAEGADAAYVFKRSGTIWSQQAYLKASNAGADDGFGSSVAISGDYAVVGAHYADSDGSGESNNSFDGAGAAYVFVRNGAVWSQQAYLKASNAGARDKFGYSVAISGDYVVVGASGESANGSNPNDNSASNAGAAYVFKRSGTIWSQQAYLKASNAGAGDCFGWSVAINGDYAVVGAGGESGNGSGEGDNSAHAAGAAYVFKRSGTIWSQQAYLKAANAGGEDEFGGSVAISGAYVVVGADLEDGNGSSPSNNSAFDAGAAYVYKTDASLRGNVNADGLINSTDALIILSCDVGLNTAAFCPMNCGDVNADGLINSTDALIILSYDVGLSVPFPVGQSGCNSSVTPCQGCP